MAFDTEHYLKATSESAQRGRKLVFALLVGSVLIFAALLNSMQNDWSRLRLNEFENAHGDYANSMVGKAEESPDRAAGQKEKEFERDPAEHREKRYESLYAAYVGAFVNNSYFVRVPLFGFSFDINNLGLLGGAGLTGLLVLLRFSLSRELSNLRTSFEEASKGPHGKESGRRFYELLAMEQVLTVPKDRFMKVSIGGRIAPKLLFLIPAAVYCWVCLHDLATFSIGNSMGARVETFVLYGGEAVFVTAILYFSVRIIITLVAIEDVWDEQWMRLEIPSGEMPSTAVAPNVHVNPSKGG